MVWGAVLLHAVVGVFFPPFPSPSHTVKLSSSLGLLCPAWMGSGANIFALPCAPPLPSPSSGVTGWLQLGGGRQPVLCPVEAGRQAVSFPQTPVVAGGRACSNNHCCPPGSSASSPRSLCTPGINRDLLDVWPKQVTWGGRVLPLLTVARAGGTRRGAKPKARCLSSLGHGWRSTTRYRSCRGDGKVHIP